jgi:hypothetical protein
MNESAPVVCFHCGQTTTSPDAGPLLNRLHDGRACPACADRLLRTLPSLVREVAGDMERLELEGLGNSNPYLPDEPA